MSPAQFKAIRLSLGLSASEFALALGYKAGLGNANQIYNFESGARRIPVRTAMLALALSQLKPNPKSDLPTFQPKPN